MKAPRRVLIVLPRHAHLMDVAGPAQVFTSAAELGGDYLVEHVAGAAEVTAHQGLGLVAGSQWPRLGRDDLVVVPGWKGERTSQPFDGATLRQVRQHWEGGGRLASICSGALALAELGILEGQHATTHHELVGQLRRHRGITVVEDVLYTCGERLHTSAGIASGIDLSLHLVAHDHGPAVAARVARTMVVPAWRPGAASQASVMLVHRDHLDDLAHRAQDILDAPDAAPMGLEQLARTLGVSGRTLARRFVRATGMTPQAYATAVRRERAATLVSHGWTRQAAAQAVGYADARSLRDRHGNRA